MGLCLSHERHTRELGMHLYAQQHRIALVAPLPPPKPRPSQVWTPHGMVSQSEAILYYQGLVQTGADPTRDFGWGTRLDSITPRVLVPPRRNNHTFTPQEAQQASRIRWARARGASRG